MKYLFRILTLAILVGATVFFAACDKKDDPGKSAAQTQIDLLVGTWTAQNVSHDNQTPEGFGSFKVTIAQAGTAETMTFTTSGRPANVPSPWDASGTLAFGTPVTEKLVFGDGATATYTVSGNNLSITFTGYTGSGYTGRVSSASGNWTFTFTK